MTRRPLYQSVREEILETLGDGPADPRTLSDAALAKRFGVSRITVRRAVDDLVASGTLYRVQGRGTFVRSRKVPEKLSLDSFIEGWLNAGPDLQSDVVRFERVPAGEAAASRLGVDPDSEVVAIRRIRRQGGAPMVIDDRYVRADRAAALTLQVARTVSLITHLRTHAGVPLERAEMEIEARVSSAAEARLLGIRAGQTVLVRNLVLVDPAGAPIMAGTSVYRADRVTYRVTVST
jgi:GntR family transcriptional regulator